MPISADREERLQLACDRYLQTQPLAPGLTFHVVAPDVHVDTHVAGGRFALDDSRPLDPADAYRSASVAKTYTAATLLRVAEMGLVDLDDSIAKWLEPELVSSVHVMDDGMSRGAQISLRQLLNHTGGIYDYATDAEWMVKVAADDQKTWTPRELVQWAIDHGTPYFPPGEGFTYSDTGYALIGFVIEAATGQLFHEAQRRLVLERAQTQFTYQEWWETEAAGGPERAHQYIAGLDTTDWNPTFDTFGGGGLVFNAADQTRFIRALFAGRVFDDPTSLAAMLTPSRHSDYALGLARTTIRGLVGWSHSGSFGAFHGYFPAREISITGSCNCFECVDDHNAIYHSILDAIAEP